MHKILGTKNFAVADRRLANTVTWHLNPPPNFNMRIPDEVRKCVVYLGTEVADGAGGKKIRYGGTGFFVSKPSKIADASFSFLVTAKHVADKLMGQTIYIRVNTQDGKSMNLKVANEPDWWFHPTDKAADVAMIPINLDQRTFDYLVLASSMFLTEATRKSKGIGAGDEVFITGLFVYHNGLAKNIPIIRTGNIAMIPEERIPIKNFGDMEAYLIEARSIGGLSGSPVFAIDQTLPEKPFYLMGLMHGHWSVDSETVVDEIAEDAGIKAGVNVGIAIVTPASKILDILHCDAMQKELGKIEAAEIARNSPTPDKR
jgi:hypothetical protein